jgi:hypothetical protein
MIKARLVGIAVSLAKQYGMHSSAHTRILHQSMLATTGQQTLNKDITYELGVSTINVLTVHLTAFCFHVFKAKSSRAHYFIYCIFTISEFEE